MDIEYRRGESLRVTLNEEDLGSLATRGYCTVRNGLVGSESKTWIRHDTAAQNPRATIDSSPDVNIYIPPDQQFPFSIAKDAMAALMGDQAMVDWFFHDGSEIIVE